MRATLVGSTSCSRHVRRGSPDGPDSALAASFADEVSYGIDAFVFVNKADERQAVRYQMVPEKVVHLDAAEAAKRPPNFLMGELPERP
jgi:catalase